MTVVTSDQYQANHHRHPLYGSHPSKKVDVIAAQVDRSILIRACEQHNRNLTRTENTYDRVVRAASFLVGAFVCSNDSNWRASLADFPDHR